MATLASADTHGEVLREDSSPARFSAVGDDDASASSLAGGVASPDMLGLLRIMAETQREVFRAVQRADISGGSRSRVLASVRFPEFDGSMHTTVRKNREWRKGVQTIRELNQLSDKELARIVFSDVSGRAKTLLEILEIADVTAPAGLERISNLLDDAFEKLAHERLDDVWQHREHAHRLLGQPMAD